MRKIISLILCVCMLVSGCMYAKPTEVHAASKLETTKKEALKAYQKFLKKYESHYEPEEGAWDKRNKESKKYCSSFAILDMNGDRIPELVTSHCNGYKDWEDHIYTFVNRKIKEVTKSGIAEICTAGGSIYTYFCDQKHLHVQYYNGGVGIEEDTAYRLTKKNKLSKYLYYSCQSNTNGSKKCEYMENGKKISSKTYQKLSKKCGKSNFSYWKENTSKERKKILS